ncbi:MAG TPA: YihY/virulence factor BrkB family protein [Bryobacteraceae bacterium]|nr:YihY/virulence factor BrkB family protein [Bryobacteraceae bacterium]
MRFSRPGAEPVNLKAVWRVTVQTVSNWTEVNPPHLSAALAFYTILSLPPLLVIFVAIAGFVIGREAATGRIVDHIQNVAGPAAAKTIRTVITHMNSGHAGLIASATSGLVLLFSASGVFGELRDSLDRIWRIRTPGSGLKGMVLYRVIAFATVLGAGLLLLILLLATTFIHVATKYFGGILPLPGALLEAANFIVTLGISALVFALLYKLIPDVRIKWHDVWIGAAVTALLFTIGKFLIGLYLATATTGSAYGAAGSLVVFMFWLYYSAQIFFLGAEFTRIFSERHGSRAVGQQAAEEIPHPKVA